MFVGRVPRGQESGLWQPLLQPWGNWEFWEREGSFLAFLEAISLQETFQGWRQETQLGRRPSECLLSRMRSGVQSSPFPGTGSQRCGGLRLWGSQPRLRVGGGAGDPQLPSHPTAGTALASCGRLLPGRDATTRPREEGASPGGLSTPE